VGSFALRDPRVFAAEWASLDVLSGGRTRLSVCAGGGGSDAWVREAAAMGILDGQRRKRMIENIAVLRHLWTMDDAPFEDEFIRFSGITLLPKPVQVPCPIWLTTNAGRLGNGQADARGSDLALRRTERIADGWMTHSVSPEGFRQSLQVILQAGQEAGRAMDGFETILATT
jgi:alkanesulfonate monooxygenase SsuD/methylene tetrahydromethanopterin reductase-like flavin-dependent oxidoreductase (luciferase family)